MKFVDSLVSMLSIKKSTARKIGKFDYAFIKKINIYIKTTSTTIYQ